MKVAALFADYDGTIAPLGVPRDDSRIFRRVEYQLKRIAALAPVCIVTAKDFSFIHPRSRFAMGWACASGLDVRCADGRNWTEERLADLNQVVSLAESYSKLGTYTELKRGPNGELLAVAIDWSGVPELGGNILRSLKPLARRGYLLVYDGHSSFADIYAAPPDKGKATKMLNRLLGVKGKVMFIGDSHVDNSAFQEAEIAIGVAHGQPLGDLRCDLIVEQARLAEFLGSLYDSGMDFKPSMPGVRRKGEMKSIESRGNHVPDKPDQRAGAGRPADGEGVQASGTRSLSRHQRLPRPGSGRVGRGC